MFHFLPIFPLTLPIQALCLCAQIRPSQILTPPRPHQQQLVLFSATLPPYLSLTSFNLHSLALDFTDSAYLSSPEMSCPFLGSAFTHASLAPSLLQASPSIPPRLGLVSLNLILLACLGQGGSVWYKVGPRLPPDRTPALPPPPLPSPGCGASWADGLDLLRQLRLCCVMQEGGGGGGRSWRGRRGGT